VSLPLSDKACAALQSPIQSDFVTCVRQLARQLADNADFKTVVREAILVVSKSNVSPAQQSQRAALIIRILQSSVTFTAEDVQGLADLPPSIRSGIASALPRQLLPCLYGAVVNAPHSERPEGQEEPRKADQLTPFAAATSATRTDLTRGTVVVLLSTEDNQEGNARLLQSDGFAAYRVSSRDDLATYLNTIDICGFVFDASFWRGRTAEEQTEILIEVVQYSSFTCLVVDTSGFVEAAKIRNVLEVERPNEPRWLGAQLRESSMLVASDLECFRLSADFITTQQHLTFVPLELSPPERLAVTAACRSFFCEHHFQSEESLESIAFKSFHEGLSSAKTMLIRFNNSGVPILLKVDTRERILDEIGRFNRYFGRADGHLRPRGHFHNDVGVIIFGLVEDGQQRFVPAPSLDFKVRHALKEETYPTDSGSIGTICASITDVVARVCSRMVELNKIHYCGPHESQAYLRASGLRELERGGVVWQIPRLESGISAFMEVAYTLIEPHLHMATVHGDLHLGNILVPNEGVPQLIDFAYSGPGHPVYDLVRLEAALYFKYLRQLGPEDEFANLQHDLTIEMVSTRELKEKYPAWWSSDVNAALLAGAICCRDAAMSILRSYDLGSDQYIACKFVLCGFSMTIPGLQFGLVRATMSAMAPHIAPTLST
jgi:hypothetical protein